MVAHAQRPRKRRFLNPMKPPAYGIRRLRIGISTALTLGPGPHHTTAGEKRVFGAIGDSAPDRWGRALMHRAERRRARDEGRAPHTLLEIDCLSRVDDSETRQGALRFAERAGGPFLAMGGPGHHPAARGIPKILFASERIVGETDTDEDVADLLLGAGVVISRRTAEGFHAQTTTDTLRSRSFRTRPMTSI